jgi:hypothetical protein
MRAFRLGHFQNVAVNKIPTDAVELAMIGAGARIGQIRGRSTNAPVAIQGAEPPRQSALGRHLPLLKQDMVNIEIADHLDRAISAGTTRSGNRNCGM